MVIEKPAVGTGMARNQIEMEFRGGLHQVSLAIGRVWKKDFPRLAITVSPSWLTRVACTRTSPAIRPGLRTAAFDNLDTQRETVARADGAEEFQAVDPGRGDDGGALHIALILHALHQRCDLPAAGDHAAELASRGGGRIGVNGDGIELLPERNDAFLAEAHRAPFEDPAQE